VIFTKALFVDKPLGPTYFRGPVRVGGVDREIPEGLKMGEEQDGKA
jgi:hypothetical protein